MKEKIFSTKIVLNGMFFRININLNKEKSSFKKKRSSKLRKRNKKENKGKMKKRNYSKQIGLSKRSKNCK